MPFEEYLEIDAMSSSALKNYCKSPAYYKFRKENPMKETPSLALGTMIHTWILENHRFNSEYAVDPEYVKPERVLKKDDPEGYEKYKSDLANYNSACEAWLNANEGKKVIKRELLEKFKFIQPYTHTENEVTVLFEHMGIKCKARIDAVHTGKGIEDIKTTADIFKAMRQFFNLHYHIQAGFYTIAYYHAYGEWPEFFKFTFISTNEFVVKETFDMTFGMMEFSREKAELLMMDLQKSIADNHFPLGIDTEIDIPSWM